jgi:molybdenum cofactor biosynthesis enzyme MoaA
MQKIKFRAAAGVQPVQLSFDTLQPATMGAINAGSPKNHRAILENLANAVSSPLRVVASSVLTRLNAPEIPAMMRAGHEMGIDTYTRYPAVPARRGGRRNEAFVFGERGILSPDPHCVHFAATRP